MTRVDLHPEDLFDHLRRGELREDERERLQRHCAVCSACAFELQVVEGDVYGGEPTNDDHVIAARALERMLTSDAAEAEVALVPVTGRGQLWLRAAALVLAGVLVGGSVSAAALAGSETAGWVTWIGSWVAWKAPAPAVDPNPSPKAVKTRGTRAPRATKLSPSAAPTVATETIETTAELMEPTVSSGETIAIAEVVAVPREKTSVVAPRARAITRNAAAAEASSVAGSALTPVEPATWLFRAASRARSEGRAHEAAALYDALQRDYAGSEVEIVTRVALGRLALAQLNDPSRALSAFDSYLTARPEGALAEEARSGRVSALRQLRRDEEARLAEAELTQRHPHTLYGGLERTAP